MDDPAISKSKTDIAAKSFNAGQIDRDAKYHIVRPKGRADWLLFFTQDGAGRFRHPDFSITIRTKQVVLIPPGTLHDYGLVEEGSRWRFLWAHFHPRPDWDDLLQSPQEPSGIQILAIESDALYRKIEDALAEMLEHFRHAQNRRNQKALNALERALLLLDEANPRVAAKQLDRRVGQALAFMHNQSKRKLPLQEVAQKVGLSASRFAHLFKEQLGESYGERLEAIRLAEAKVLLESRAQSISEIAHQVGFEDPLYFSRRYKKLHGQSPRSHRSALWG